jgi:hypothetical protein
MELRTLLGLSLLLVAARPARADFLELTQKGATQLQTTEGQGGSPPIIEKHLVAGAGSPYGFLRGMIVTEHDSGGLLSYGTDLNLTPAQLADLNGHPEKNVLFLPYAWIKKGSGGALTWTYTILDWSYISTVHYEIDTLDDLSTMMSWRCQLTTAGTDPSTAMQAGLQFFERQLDPQNQLQIGGGGGQAAPNTAHEGYLTRLLMYGPMGSAERLARLKGARAGNGPIGQYGQAAPSPGTIKYTPTDPDWWDESPEGSLGKLVEAVARCRHASATSTQPLYNIPSSDGIAQCSRLAAQLLTSDLAGVPPAVAQANPSAARIRSFAFKARTTLLGLIESVTPDRVAALAKRQVQLRPNESPADAVYRYTSLDDELPASVFDIADAALDVLLFNPVNTTQLYGMFKPQEDDKRRIVDVLLRVASGSQSFTGTVMPAGEESNAGKALRTLTLLAEQSDATGAPFRSQILDQVASSDNPCAAAAKQALLVADLAGNNANADDVQHEVQQLFEVALAAPSVVAPGSNVIDPRTVNAIIVLKQLAGGRSSAANAINQRVQQLRTSQQNATGTASEASFLQTFDNLK